MVHTYGEMPDDLVPIRQLRGVVRHPIEDEVFLVVRGAHNNPLLDSRLAGMLA